MANTYETINAFIYDTSHNAVLTAFGTAPATSVYALAVEAALVANVSGTPTALTATGSSLNVNITGGSSGGTQYTDGTAESAGAFTITVAGLYNGTDVVGLRGDSNNDLYVRTNDGTHAITAAISAWGSAPTGTFVEGVNANLFIGGVIASSAASGIQLVGISGHSGVTLDAAINSGAAPTNTLWSTVAPTTVAQAAVTPVYINSTASKVLKASAGNLYGCFLLNLAESTSTATAEIMYIHFFNTTTTTGLATSAWLFALPIPAPGIASVSGTGAGNPLSLPPGALALANFSNGIVIVVNTTSTSNTTAAGTNPVGTLWIE